MLYINSVERRRRHLDHHRHVRARARPRPGRGRGAEPRLAGQLAAAAGGDQRRRHGAQAVARHADVLRAALAQRHLRPAVHQQLRLRLRRRRAEARQGRRRRQGVRLRVRHAHLAQARPHGEPRHHREPTSRRRSASRTCRCRPARSASRPRRAARASSTRCACRAGWSTRPSSPTSSSARKPDGSFVRVRDIGRVELGARRLQQRLDLQRQAGGGDLDRRWCPAPTRSRPPSSSRPSWRRSRPPSRRTSSYEHRLRHLRRSSKASVEEVIHTFIEALVLVLIVVFLFLQNWRTTLIPMLAVPVSLVATFAAFQLLGFTHQHAVAVRHGARDRHRGRRRDRRGRGGRAQDEHAGSPSRDATIKAMDEVQGPVVAIALILAAVFVPMAFHPRRHRPAVQAVRDDGRGVDDVLGAGRADADAGAVRRCC